MNCKRKTQILVILFLIASSGSLAQSKTSFGSTNASRCYTESNLPRSDYGLRFCTDAIDNDDLLLRDLAATYTNRGIIFAANGRFDQAMADHNQAMLLAPNMGKIYVNRGNVFHQTHDYLSALADYDKALTLENAPVDIIYYNRALTLIRLKRWDDARASLESSLAINPDSTRVRNKLDEFKDPREEPDAAVTE